MYNYRFLYLVFIISYLLLLIFLSLNPWIRPTATEAVIGLSWDKLEHSMAYTILSLLFFLTLVSYNIHFSITVLFTVLFATISIGGLLEIAQSTLTTNRSGSWDDAMANAFGASLGCVSYGLIWLFYQRQHKSSIL